MRTIFAALIAMLGLCSVSCAFDQEAILSITNTTPNSFFVAVEALGEDQNGWFRESAMRGKRHLGPGECFTLMPMSLDSRYRVDKYDKNLKVYMLQLHFSTSEGNAKRKSFYWRTKHTGEVVVIWLDDHANCYELSCLNV